MSTERLLSVVAAACMENFTGYSSPFTDCAFGFTAAVLCLCLLQEKSAKKVDGLGGLTLQTRLIG